MQVHVALRHRLTDMWIDIERDPDEDPEDPSECVLSIEWRREQGLPEASIKIAARPDDLRALAARIVELLDRRGD